MEQKPIHLRCFLLKRTVIKTTNFVESNSIRVSFRTKSFFFLYKLLYIFTVRTIINSNIVTVNDLNSHLSRRKLTL